MKKNNKEVSVRKSNRTEITINPPLKAPPRNPTIYGEAYNNKIEWALKLKAISSGFDYETVYEVYQRGISLYPENHQLSPVQYAMNRVNSFIKGGRAMEEDYDIIPISEKRGMKGTGGAMRPHIKREKSPYNNKIIYHVVDSKGITKHSTYDEIAAKRHLAQKYNDYFVRESVYIDSADIKMSTTGRKIPAHQVYLGSQKMGPKKLKVQKVQAVGEEKMKGEDPCWKGYEMVGQKIKAGRKVPNCVPKNEEVEKSFNEAKKFGYDAINARFKKQTGQSLEDRAKHYAATSERLKKMQADYEAQNKKKDNVSEAKTPAWSRKEGKNPEGGLNRKGIASYRAQNPGSKLSMAVTTEPSKLKHGSKPWKRRKSFCARMSGVDGPMKKPNGKPTRKALALRKWNC